MAKSQRFSDEISESVFLVFIMNLLTSNCQFESMLVFKNIHCKIKSISFDLSCFFCEERFQFVDIFSY